MPLDKMTGIATTDLGFGGSLQQQVDGETEEQRRKRLLQQQDRNAMGPAGSPATQALFGGFGAGY